MMNLEPTRFNSFAAFFDSHIIKEKPAIFKNFLRDRELLEISPDILSNKFYDINIPVNYHEDSYFELNHKKGGPINEPISIKFNEFVSKYWEDGRYYIQQLSIDKHFPSIVDHLPLGRLLDEPLIKSKNLWMGSKGSTSPLHYDLSNNFFIQYYGKKKFTLFAVEQTESLYPYSITESCHPYISKVDISSPDVEAFPKFKDADPIEVILDPGDILFMPACIWHQAVSEEKSMGVNVWFKAFDFQLLNPNMIRLMPAVYHMLVKLFNGSTRYQFSSYYEYCDSLSQLGYLTESLMAYISLLENYIKEGRGICGDNGNSDELITSLDIDKLVSGPGPTGDASNSADIIKIKNLVDLRNEAINTKGHADVGKISEEDIYVLKKFLSKYFV